MHGFACTKCFQNYSTFNFKKSIKNVLLLGSTVTVMSPDGTPVQVNASALQAAASQNAVGMFG